MTKQCQYCFKAEHPPEFKLKSCKQCSRAHYCSLKVLSAEAASDSASLVLDPKPVENKLKQWLQVFRPVLDITLINALSLKTNPERCTTEMLCIEVRPTSHKDIPRYFTVEKTSSLSIAEAKQMNSGLNRSMFDFVLEKSRQIRADRVIGVAIAIIHIKEVDIAHLTPAMMRFSCVKAPRDREWASTLTDRVAAGNVVIYPI
ncbi:hypothetical protein FIBSPDRAFT_935159 [Athelia psychrophila]|uniref:Uncharacterized protein n=1 Tax=Athelia psychrophila TaxID=1759441 RepID=A0A166E716_9AGAM|nr:hypothetical protein FIBSPDRAFT_935159 [Fibularhizoctonia sp. CBS 109695]